MKLSLQGQAFTVCFFILHIIPARPVVLEVSAEFDTADKSKFLLDWIKQNMDIYLEHNPGEVITADVKNVRDESHIHYKFKTPNARASWSLN